MSTLVHLVRPPTVAPPPGAQPPLLILLHGVGSNERSIASLAPRMDPRFVVLSARSPLQLGPDAYGWFHVQFTAQGPVIDRAEAEAGWKLLAQFVDEAVTAYACDPGRVYLAGFSQGAILSLATVLTAPQKIAGVAAMSGRLLPEVLPHAAPVAELRGKPVLIVHGSADDKLRVDYARDAKSRLAAFEIALDYEEFAMGHEVTAKSLARVTSWLTGQLDAR